MGFHLFIECHFYQPKLTVSQKLVGCGASVLSVSTSPNPPNPGTEGCQPTYSRGVRWWISFTQPLTLQWSSCANTLSPCLDRSYFSHFEFFRSHFSSHLHLPWNKLHSITSLNTPYSTPSCSLMLCVTHGSPQGSIPGLPKAPLRLFHLALADSHTWRQHSQLFMKALDSWEDNSLFLSLQSCCWNLTSPYILFLVPKLCISLSWC